MLHANLAALEEYNPDRFVIKPVYDSPYSFSKVIHMAPGQCVPVHPHAGKEVILFPQKGYATLCWDDGKEQALDAGNVYYQGPEPTFGVTNLGPEPFQMLVLVVHIAGGAA